MQVDADALVTIHAGDISTAEKRPTLRLHDQPREQWAALTRAFLQRHVRWPSKRLMLAENDDVQRVIAEHYHRINIDHYTVTQRATTWARHFLRALRSPIRWADRAGTPWLNRPAFVVGAGPSLDHNGHLLRECQRFGPIVATNTSLDACLHHGVTPDVVVCCEAADLTAHFSNLPADAHTIAVLDVMGHPAHWQRLPNALAVAHHEPNLIPHVLQAGGQPLNFGGSVSCAATSLSLLWGAAPIVLLGQDCGYTGGRFYCEGTQRSDMLVRVRDGFCVFEGHSFERGPMPVTYRKGWGGGEDVPSDHSMDNVHGWFEKVAGAHPDMFINASEGGAGISGAVEAKLSDVLSQLKLWPPAPYALPTVEPIDPRQARDHIRALAEQVLAGTLRNPLDFPLINMWTFPVESSSEFRALSLREQHERVLEAMRQGAAEVMEELGDGGAE